MKERTAAWERELGSAVPLPRDFAGFAEFAVQSLAAPAVGFSGVLPGPGESERQAQRLDREGPGRRQGCAGVR